MSTSLGQRPTTARILGESPAMRRVLAAARMVAATDANVLIIGEDGTGRQLLAREIHRLGPGSSHACVAVACAGLPEVGLRRYLDGNGGAVGGTLILTEVAELSAEAQALLLRYLTAWEASRAMPRPGVRVIATTGRDLASEVGLGAFRRDLYYRLCVVPLELPPLRDRPGDILPLVEEIGARVAQAQRQRPPRYTAMALRLLRRYTWPGNVRELRNLCERMAILFGGREVTPDDLPWEIRRGDAAPTEPVPFQLPPNGIDLTALEAELIRQALGMAAGNKSRAARLLGLTRDTLLYRMEKHLIKA